MPCSGNKEVDNLLEAYGRRSERSHGNKAHQPFTRGNPDVNDVPDEAAWIGYEGPITLELHHKTPTEEIASANSFSKTVEAILIFNYCFLKLTAAYPTTLDGRLLYRRCCCSLKAGLWRTLPRRSD